MNNIKLVISFPQTIQLPKNYCKCFVFVLLLDTVEQPMIVSHYTSQTLASQSVACSNILLLLQSKMGKAHMISLICLMLSFVNKHKVIKSMQCFLCEHNVFCIIRDQNLLSFCLWGPVCTPSLESNQRSYPWVKIFPTSPKTIPV